MGSPLRDALHTFGAQGEDASAQISFSLSFSSQSGTVLAAMPQVKRRSSATIPSTQPFKKARIERRTEELNASVETIRHLFRRVLLDYALKRDEGYANPAKREERSGEWLESMVAEEYEIMKTPLLDVIRWLGCVPAKLMRDCQRRGEVVVFTLGSDSPLDLFKKVYNRPPISSYGLRCGYIRWRASADEPWAREAKWADRCCMCIQLPQ